MRHTYMCQRLYLKIRTLHASPISTAAQGGERHDRRVLQCSGDEHVAPTTVADQARVHALTHAMCKARFSTRPAR